jgi:hypothetical protein
MDGASDSPAYTFRSATRRDLRMLDAWLRTPEVVRWWGDPAREAALLHADLDELNMVMEIVAFGGRPFASTRRTTISTPGRNSTSRNCRGGRARSTRSSASPK